MSKIGVSDLASILVDRHGLSVKDAEAFVNQVFDVLVSCLNNDKVVKIKGLGTFKITNVSARESVDINTGERIVIDGRDKLSFTPDTSMRDLVNRPFAQFDTVVINDGVDLSSIDERILTENPDVIEEESYEIIPAKGQEPSILPSSSPIEDAEKVAEVVSPTSVEAAESDVEYEETPIVSSQNEEEISTDDNEDSEEYEETSNHKGRNIVIFIIGFLVLIALSYVIYNKFFARNNLVDTKPLPTKNINNKSVSLKKDTSTAVKQVPDSVDKPILKSQETPNIAKNTQPAGNVEYVDNALVRTGAYNIIGVAQTVIVGKGQTLETISKAHLGAGMECYVQAINDGKTSFNVGDKVNIPELQLKKRSNVSSK